MTSAAKSAYAAADDDVHRAHSIAPAVIVVVSAFRGLLPFATGFVMNRLLFLLWCDVSRFGVGSANLGRFMWIDAGLFRGFRKSGIHDGRAG
jgi:hypothetical protein